MITIMLMVSLQFPEIDGKQVEQRCWDKVTPQGQDYTECFFVYPEGIPQKQYPTVNQNGKGDQE